MAELVKRCCYKEELSKEKVLQQGEHGPKEDGGEEQCEDNEGQEEETQGENTEESQGEKTGETRHCRETTEGPQGDGPGSRDGTRRRSGNKDGTRVWTKGTGRYDQAVTAIRLGTRRERDGRTRRRVENKMAAEVEEQLGARLTMGFEERRRKARKEV